MKLLHQIHRLNKAAIHYSGLSRAEYYETTISFQVRVCVIYFTRGPGGVLIAQFDTDLQKWVKTMEFNWSGDALPDNMYSGDELEDAYIRKRPGGQI